MVSPPTFTGRSHLTGHCAHLGLSRKDFGRDDISCQVGRFSSAFNNSFALDVRVGAMLAIFFVSLFGMSL